MLRYVRFSALSLFMLVLLRVGIGWHFFFEGYWKLTNPDWSPEPFLKSARGPLAAKYHELMWDHYGLTRLDVAAMKDRWTGFADQAAEHYDFSLTQQNQATELVEQRENELKEMLQSDVKTGEYRPEVSALIRAIEEWRKQENDRIVQDIPYRQKRHGEAWAELQRDSAEVLAAVEALEAGLIAELNELAGDAQLRDAGEYSRPKTQLDYLKTLTTYGLLAIGACLIVGLFTRFAAVAGAVFLLTAVILPQWPLPGYYPPLPPQAGHSILVNKEFVEMLALLFLATTIVGRWGGLDYFIHNRIVRPLLGRRDSEGQA